MKVQVNLEFQSAAEAATYLAGLGVSAKPTWTEPAKTEAPVVEAPKAAAPAKAAPKAAATKAKAPAPVVVDKEAILNKVRDIATQILALPNAEENKAYFLNLVEQHGGSLKASTIPDANLQAFLDAVNEYATSLSSASADEPEESLV